MASKKEKSKAPYHHGNLEQAMVKAAVQTIRKHGIEALTLRGVGATLGVSRSALYRHFADKEALLARVSLEGFKGLMAVLQQSYAAEGRAAESCLPNMTAAYVRWAVANPSHYLVMFGAPMKNIGDYEELLQAAEGSFRELLNAIVERQRAGNFPTEHPLRVANALWSLVHGIATLSMDSLLERGEGESGLAGVAAPELASFACAAMIRGFGGHASEG